jgi:hypothetical protein
MADTLMDGLVQVNVKGAIVTERHPFLDLMVERLKVDVELFFRIAYVWRFPGKQLPDTQVFKTEVSWYDHYGIEPPYVQAYLTHLKNDQEMPPPT